MALQIGWFSTGRDKAARDLLNAVYREIKSGHIDADISFVFCNRTLGESRESDLFIKTVEDYGIDLVCYPSRDFQPQMRMRGRNDPVALNGWRSDFHIEVMRRLSVYGPRLHVLAGYMLIVSEEMCERLDMINLHPAEPKGPSGTWQEVIWKLIAERADTTGVMMHLVTSSLDEGPPVTYCTFPIKGPLFDGLWNDMDTRLTMKSLAQIMEKDGESNELFAEIRRQGFQRELPLMIHTLKAFAEGRIRIENKTVLMNDEILKDGLCLNREIETLLWE